MRHHILIEVALAVQEWDAQEAALPVALKRPQTDLH